MPFPVRLYGPSVWWTPLPTWSLRGPQCQVIAMAGLTLSSMLQASALRAELASFMYAEEEHRVYGIAAGVLMHNKEHRWDIRGGINAWETIEMSRFVNNGLGGRGMPLKFLSF